MKNILILLFLIFSFLVYSQDKQRTVVLEFQGKDIEKNLIETIFKDFISILSETKEFSIVERKDLDKIIKEQNIQLSDEFNDSLAVDIGNLAGAELVIIGEINRTQGKIHISVKGVDVESGIMQFSKSISVENETSILDSLPLLVNQIVLEKKGKTDDKLSLKEKQLKLDELNFRINTMKTDIVNMESNYLSLKEIRNPVLANMIVWTSLF